MLLLLTILIISGFVVIASGLLVMILVRPKDEQPVEQTLQRPQSHGLFDYESIDESAEKSENNVRGELLRRVQSGDWYALEDAGRSDNPELYRSLLDLAVDESGDERLSSLVAHISNSKELRATAHLALRVLNCFRPAPSLKSATEMLHIAALSDDAEMYHHAIDALIDAWRSGKLARLSSSDLRELIESQFWVLAPEARQGGAGYRLKRRLAGIRRELAAGEPVR